MIHFTVQCPNAQNKADFKFSCLKWAILGPISAGSLLFSAGCYGQRHDKVWNSSQIPTYEPLPTDISGFPSSTDKLKFSEITADMRERLLAHHVDAPHANAVLWQFHFFAPVKYLTDDCSTYIDLIHRRTFRNEDQQIARMGDAAKDVLDRYDHEIPYSQLADGPSDNVEKNISGRNPSEMPIPLEFLFALSLGANLEAPLKFSSPEQEMYFQETRKIGYEVRNKKSHQIPSGLQNYHIRNFIINLYIMSLNAGNKNNQLPISVRQRAANRARAYFNFTESNYQEYSKKLRCVL